MAACVNVYPCHIPCHMGEVRIPASMEQYISVSLISSNLIWNGMFYSKVGDRITTRTKSNLPGKCNRLGRMRPRKPEGKESASNH